MKTIKQVSIRPEYFRNIPETLEEGILYISLEYGCAIHNCLCGCGNKTVTPLGPSEWTLTDNSDKITMTPSIGNFNFPCKSHYIITNNVANFI